MRNQPAGFSIESVTRNIAEHLPSGADARIFRSSYLSRGVLDRFRAVREASRQQGDVNHITGDIHFIALGLNPHRTVLTVHDVERLESDGYSSLKKAFYKMFWLTIPMSRSARITTISEASRRAIVEHTGVPGERINVIPNGVDDRFRTVDLGQNAKNGLLRNSSGKPTVLHVSNSKPNKNIERLIDALTGLDVKWVKVGALTEREAVLLRDRRIDHVQFDKVDTDTLIKIYNSVDCLAFPSTVEGFGLPVAEAQKCGCPVVTSNVSSLPEVAGDGALLVDPYSVTSIRQGILDVLTQPELKHSLISKGRSNAERFDWSKIAQQYYDVYADVHRHQRSRSHAR